MSRAHLWVGVLGEHVQQCGLPALSVPHEHNLAAVLVDIHLPVSAGQSQALGSSTRRLLTPADSAPSHLHLVIQQTRFVQSDVQGREQSSYEQ